MEDKKIEYEKMFSLECLRLESLTNIYMFDEGKLYKIETVEKSTLIN